MITGILSTIKKAAVAGLTVEGGAGKGDSLGMSDNQLTALLKALRKRESGDRYSVINKWGYLGAYQFGASALSAIGYIKSSHYNIAVSKVRGIATGANATAHKAFLQNPSNWTIAGGQDTYLSRKDLQDEACYKLMLANYKVLAKSKVTGNPAHNAGLLVAAHLKGVGAALKYAKNGTISRDGLGTGIDEYYRLGYNAVKEVA